MPSDSLQQTVINGENVEHDPNSRSVDQPAMLPFNVLFPLLFGVASAGAFAWHIARSAAEFLVIVTIVSYAAYWACRFASSEGNVRKSGTPLSRE